MARKKMAGTTDTLLLVGGGLVLLYLLMKPKTATTQWQTVPGQPGVLVPWTPGSPTAAQTSAASSTNTAISAGASVVNNLINQIFG